MQNVIVVDRAGIEHTIGADEGLSLREVLSERGFDELLALCGGCCSCATCHVYVHPAFSSMLSPLTEEENDLLDSSEHRQENSRLSCQLVVDQNFEGMKISIAPED
ncbi:2Fe-2S iron-sulfur cluster-binding protein [Sphingobium tyrosinilyticum]|uniref:2Fe-2S iron-sulfur cluster-binding protein n=1 Tax=Sphingobium tyrosinilyticum TaxID=2715436 RepID=A0ABV9F3S4_9SPHN